MGFPSPLDPGTSAFNGPRHGAFLVWAEKTQTMRFDAVMAETHTKKSTLTTHSVEKGSAVTDHIQVDQEECALEVLVTNTPIREHGIFGTSEWEWGNVTFYPPKYTPPLAPTPGSLFRAVGGAITSLLNGDDPPVKAHVLVPKNSNTNPMHEAQDQLWDMVDGGVLVDVYTRTRIYKGMVLTAAPMSRTPEGGESCTFHLEFKGLRVVESGTAAVPKDPRAQAKVDKGMKNKVEVDEDKESVARYGLGAAAGL